MMQQKSIDTILLEAVEIEDAAERESYLDRTCGSDAQLRQKVEKLIADHFAAGDFLEEPLVERPACPLDAETDAGGNGTAAGEPPGTRIGPYVIREEIAEGGFGAVYVAEQEEPVRRKVALKIIKPGMDTKEVIARFEAERQALALMDHPHVAKVFDAGTTDAGRPYFVMELVRGRPITEFCDQERLSNRDRLKIFVDICRAVQHAHQKGVIHRDLKPSNILVTLDDDRPVPKVIDFGVSKALTGKLTDKTVYTAFGQMVGTPLYMAPEQAALTLLDVDTRSDVYSLGVLLYELLTGTTPFDRETLKTVGFDELRRIIREEEPPRPSARVSTLNAALLTTACDLRRIDRSTLANSLRGELDWIVMKALEKDRNRRYESASAFATDIERHLKDEPVEACPPSLGYRLRKFLRRNRGTVLAVTALAAALVAGITGTTLGMLRAIDAEQAAENRSQEALENANLAQQKAREAESERKRAESNLDLAMAALDAVYLDGIGEEKLLGRPAGGEAGQQPREARRRLTEWENDLVRRGLGFYEQFVQRNRQNPKAKVQTAAAYYRVALLHVGLDENEAAQENYRRAIALYEELLEGDPDNAEHLVGLSRAYFNFAYAQSEWDNAQKLFLKCLEITQRGIDSHSDMPDLYLLRGNLNWILGETEKTLTDFETAIRLDPDNVKCLLMAGWWCCSGLDMSKRDYEKALRYGRHAVELAPGNPEAHAMVGFAYLNQGLTATDALEHFDRAVEIDPIYLPARAYRCRVYREILHDAGRALEEANVVIQTDPDYWRGYYERARAQLDLGNYEQAKHDIEHVLRLSPLTGGMVNLVAGQVYQAMGERQKALDVLSVGIELFPKFTLLYLGRAKVLAELEKYEQALADLETALELSGEEAGPQISIHVQKGKIFRSQGKHEEAIAEFQINTTAHPDHPWSFDELCRSQLRLGQKQEALASISTAIEIRPFREHYRRRRATIAWDLGRYDLAAWDYAVAEVFAAAAKAGVDIETMDLSNWDWPKLQPTVTKGLEPRRANQLTPSLKDLSRNRQ